MRILLAIALILLPINSYAFTAGNILEYLNQQNTQDSGVTLGTMTDTKYCTYSASGTQITCTATGGGGSMTWPTGAGVPLYSGSSTWGTTFAQYGTTGINWNNFNFTNANINWTDIRNLTSPTGINWNNNIFSNFGVNWTNFKDIGSQTINWYDINLIANQIQTNGTGQSTIGYGIVLNNGGNTTANGGDVTIKNSSAATIFNAGATSSFVFTAPYVLTVTQSATPSISVTNNNGTIYSITGLAQAITSMTTNLTGSATQGAIMEIQFTDNGTGRAITWGASFASSTVSLPTTTVASTLLSVFLQYNGSVWVCIGVA